MTGRGEDAPDLEVLVSRKECGCRALIGRALKILGGRGECSGGFGCWGMGEKRRRESMWGKDEKQACVVPSTSLQLITHQL